VRAALLLWRLGFEYSDSMYRKGVGVVIKNQNPIAIAHGF
jgi:hypothetical protein